MDYESLQARDILVPVDGSEAGFNALALACSISRKNKGTVYVVYVIAVARNLPLDAELVTEAQDAEAILSRAEKVASEVDFKIQGEILQARDAGHAIVDEAIERGVNAIVLGVKFERPLGEFTMGDTAQYVMKNAPCQVLLCRAAVRE